MNNKSTIDIERLKEQLLSNSKLKQKDEQKQKICKRLHEQLVEKKAVVKLQRMDDECFNLIDSLQQRLLFMQDVLSPSKKDGAKKLLTEEKATNENVKLFKKEFIDNGLIELNLSSDSSDDEILSTIVAKKKAQSAIGSSLKKPDKDVQEMEMVIDLKNINQEEHEVDSQQSSQPICSSVDSDTPLAMRRLPRERKSSYKSLCSSPSSSIYGSKKHRSVSHGKKETAVTTSGVAYHDDDIIVEEDCVTPHTFNIRIPSLFTRQVHQLRLNSLEFGRKVLNSRARQAKQKCLQLQQQQQQQDCLTNPKRKKKTQKKNEQLLRHQDFLHQHDAQFSQLIEDVMNDAVNDETLQATNALENINNDINDNYESLVSLLPLSQSSLSQNSNLSRNESDGNIKKRRKYSKRSNEEQPKGPVKKRGRKPKNKLDASSQPQPPTKSNLAKYVEYFANDCELLPTGSQTPAASSTMSQPLVSSTTQNFELIEPQQQQTNQVQQQPITYFIDGDWANGGPCQLVQTTGMTIDAGQISQDTMSAPFQDFVNYIDNNTTDTGNNVIARVLDNCNSLPIANMGFKNIFQTRQLQQQQQTTQNILNQQPVINIQIPSLPLIPPSINNNTGSPPPPMAHLHESGVLDLSIKTLESNSTINSFDILNRNNKNSNHIFELSSPVIEQDNCLPLDLSKKNASLYPNCNQIAASNREESTAESQLSVAENQDDDFIRRLIETSDFDLRPQELTKDCNHDAGYDDAKSFKAALSMPLLEFDVPDLDQFVENSTAKINNVDGRDKIKDIVIENDSTNFISNTDSNYASMNESNSNILNSPFGNEIHFADQSTKEIFNKLLDIQPTKDDGSCLEYVGDKENTFSLVDLDESTFVPNNVENSTMYKTENVTKQKNSNETQDNYSIIQQIILKSADEKQKNNNNDNKTAAAPVQKFIPRILKRRNSLLKITPPLSNYQQKSTDDHAKVYNKEGTIETTNILTNNDCGKNLSQNLIVQHENTVTMEVVNENDNDHVKKSSDLNVLPNEHLTNKKDNKQNELIIAEESSNLNISKTENLKQKQIPLTTTENSINSINKSENIKNDNTKQSTKAENLHVEQLTEILNINNPKDMKGTKSYSLKNSNNSNKLIKTKSSEKSTEKCKKTNKPIQIINSPEKSTKTYISINLEMSESISLEKLKSPGNSTKIENDSLEKSNKSISEKSTEFVKTINLEKNESNSLEKAKQLIQINSSEKFTETDVLINLEMSESNSLEESNKSNKSPKKSTESNVSINLDNCEIVSLEKLNKSITEKSIKPTNLAKCESGKSINTEISESVSLEKLNETIQIKSPKKSTQIENYSLEKSNKSISEKSTDNGLSINLEMSENKSLENLNKSIKSPEKFTESDVLINLKESESNSGKKTNKLSIQINSPEKSIESDVLINLEKSESNSNSLEKTNKLIQIDSLEKSIEPDVKANKSLIQIKSPEKSTKTDVSINLENFECVSLEKLNNLLPERSTESDDLINLATSESNSLEKLNKSIKSPGICSESDVSVNLESISLENSNKSTQIKSSEIFLNTESDSLGKLNNSISEKEKESDVSINLEKCESDSLEKSNKSINSPDIYKKSDVSINIEMSKNDSLGKSNTIPEKSTETDISTNFKMSKSDSNKSIKIKATENYTESNVLMELENSESQCIEKLNIFPDMPLNLEISKNDILDKSNTLNKSIQIKSFNLEMPKIDNSKILKDDSILDHFMLLNEMSEQTPDDIRTSNTISDFNTVFSNEKVIFSFAKTALIDDDALLTDSDTISRKSYDDILTTQQDVQLKIEDSKMETNNMEYEQPQSMDLQNDNSDHEDLKNTPQTNIELFTDTVESKNEPLCLKTDIQKKYYMEASIGDDVMDLSVKCDTDMEDNLIIDLCDTQSPKVVNNVIYDLKKDELNGKHVEIMENSLTSTEIPTEKYNNLVPTDVSNDKMDSQNINYSVENILEENKPQSSKYSTLKASDLTHLTPLELDSKLEETLDFDEDFDDALSLATSCFDSPNDDRFEESLLDDNEQQQQPPLITKITSNDTPCSIDNQITEQTSTTISTSQISQPSSSNGLRNFKIPKLNKSLTLPKSNDFEIKCKEGSNLTSSSIKINIPNIPTNIIMKQAIVKLENITRTVKNELAATGSVNVMQLQQAATAASAIPTQSSAKQNIKINFTNKTELSPTTSLLDPQNSQALPLADNLIKLFGITCQPYLVNKCYAITHCPLSHQLNDSDSVFQALSSLNSFDLSEAYRYIYNHSNMFKVFFIVFCNLYTLRKDRTKLLNMINDVERYPEYSQFVITIYEAIVKCGLNRINACRQILKRSRERTTFNIDALVAIIMKSDWTMFTDYIEQFTEEIYKYNFCIGVLEQMVPAVLNSKGPQLKQVFGKCVQNLRREDTGLLLNSPSLIQCVALLTKNT